MSFLPGADTAVVADEKVRDHLLDARRPNNGGKAEQFLRCGFASDRHDLLAAALVGHATNNQIVAERSTALNKTYVVRCCLRTPARRNPCRTSA